MQMNRKSLWWWLTLGYCLVTFLAVSQTAPAQERKPAAEIIALVGDAEIKSPQAPGFRKAQLKDVLYPQDQIRTLANSRAKLWCQDETILMLGENTTMEITKFQMDASGRRQQSLLTLLDGAMRFIVHKFYAGFPPNIEVQGKTAIMGIRGTDAIITTRSPDTVYHLEGTPFYIVEKTTGQGTTVGPMYFVEVLPGGRFRIGIITPDMARRLIQTLRVAHSFVPVAITSLPAPVRELLARLDLGNPFFRQDSPFRYTFDPSIGGGQAPLATSHQFTK